MKKYLFLSLLASAMIYANGIDVKSVKIEFEGYKTPDMIGTKGVFKNSKLTFGKDSSSLSSQLKGANAVLSPNDIDMGDNNGIITTNIIETFFKVLNSKSDIKVSFENIVEGEDKGVISAKVTIGKQSDIVPMIYNIKDGKLVAKGTLDLHTFSNGAKALQALSGVAAGHMGISWSVVDIVFSADLAK